ncbi:MAG: CBS domain-containing protein [Gammaproteobacteria bacterium]|nr:MAG: CBS domain-containing protein [Gammaproteobacteria bacterium]
MSDPDHSSHPRPSLLQRLRQWRQPRANSRQDIRQLLRDARHRKVIDTDVLGIMEGALTVSELQVREVMVPRTQMTVVNADDTPQSYLKQIIESGHSRFPVLGEGPDEVLGILLAKDLLVQILHQDAPATPLEKLLRPATFVPESKRLNVLLREFRENRNHMAIVVNEYGNISGLVTIEDVLEEIVGEIEDEYDIEENEYIHQLSDDEYMIKAVIPIELFNNCFKARLPDDEFDTIGGLVIHTLGHLPKRNEETTLGEFRFRVLSADKRRIHLLRMQILPSAETSE